MRFAHSLISGDKNQSNELCAAAFTPARIVTDGPALEVRLMADLVYQTLDDGQVGGIMSRIGVQERSKA